MCRTKKNRADYRCLCNVHVEDGARAIAVLAIVSYLTSLVPLAFSELDKQNALDNILYMALYFVIFANILCHIGIIYAQKRRKCALYLPYLALAVVQACLWLFSLLAAIIFLIFWTKSTLNFLVTISEEPQIRPNPNLRLMLKEVLFAATLFCVVLFSLLWLANAYLVWVVWRAYRVMREEHSRRKINLRPVSLPNSEMQNILKAELEERFVKHEEIRLKADDFLTF